VKPTLIAIVALLAGCDADLHEQHVKLLDRGCVIKSRGVIGQDPTRFGPRPVNGTTYSCPAYETTVRD